jgi:hypothetical protein
MFEKELAKSTKHESAPVKKPTPKPETRKPNPIKPVQKSSQRPTIATAASEKCAPNPFETSRLEDEIRREAVNTQVSLKKRYIRERYDGKFPGKLLTHNPY